MANTIATIKYLGQKEAQELDEELMGPEFGFTNEQLMELAGLSVACAVNQIYSPAQQPNVLIVCGPGNNGGDGLVVARHLFHFGFNIYIFYPKQPQKQHLLNLVKQCNTLNIQFINELVSLESYQLIIDAIFGFSFNGSIRAPFDTILQIIAQSKLPIVSVDIPSGWPVEESNPVDSIIQPNVLVSLTAPKLCALNFKGIHYLGGRFVPPKLALKYELNLPKYEGSNQIVLI
eukprot:TRINITY_DN821_c0_g6_i1.p1 TRINITY_DN821_c0_g6~~TRINITY_DN821_c0_g6_i1.p1  ORF type:complete len:232 (-),score=86.70 TRINITY_DN821_c0_g6_i1:107-802(-)